MELNNIDARWIAANVPPNRKEVWIVFHGGRPSANPAIAEVAVGGTVIWRTAPDDRTPFEVIPKEMGGEINIPSHAVGDHQELELGVGNQPGRFRYGIKANGITVDPDVVIR